MNKGRLRCHAVSACANDSVEVATAVSQPKPSTARHQDGCDGRTATELNLLPGDAAQAILPYCPSDIRMMHTGSCSSTASLISEGYMRIPPSPIAHITGL